MPLDAAIRELGNEEGADGLVFAPVINPDGSYTIIPDSAHLLNGLPRATNGAGVVSKFGPPGFPSSPGEGIIPGTKGEYVDEYVIGIEREVATSIVVKARWTDRRIGRAIEDIFSSSPEGSTIIPSSSGGIANPTRHTDIAINERELTY